MKNLKRQNPGQLFVAQELINKVIKLNYSVAELRYFKNSKTLHEYDSKNNNLNTKPINSSQDLKKYIESKIYE